MPDNEANVSVALRGGIHENVLCAGKREIDGRCLSKPFSIFPLHAFQPSSPCKKKTVRLGPNNLSRV